MKKFEEQRMGGGEEEMRDDDILCAWRKIVEVIEELKEHEAQLTEEEILLELQEATQLLKGYLPVISYKK